MILRMIVVIVALATAGAARADTLRCEFFKGVINAEDRYQPTAGPGYVRRGWKKPEPIDAKNPEMALTVKFTPGESKATMAGNNDITEVAQVPGQWYRSFIEFTPGGGVHVLTVDVAKDREGRYLAAYSRHAVLLDALIVSQYWGYCR